MFVDLATAGAQAGAIPVVTVESFLQINYRKSQELGLTVQTGC